MPLSINSGAELHANLHSMMEAPRMQQKPALPQLAGVSPQPVCNSDPDLIPDVQRHKRSAPQEGSSARWSTLRAAGDVLHHPCSACPRAGRAPGC
jgi:hypothetical protein